MSDDFNRDRDAWLRRILSDRSLPSLAVPVALDLALRFGRTTRACFPKQATIAEAIGTHPDNVQKVLRQLATRGFIATSSKNGRRNGNTYRMTLGGSTYPAVETGLIRCTDRVLSGRRTGSYRTSEGNLRTEPLASASSSSPVPLAKPTTTDEAEAAAAPISDEDLWNELFNAAAGRIVDGLDTRDLQPIRALMAAGADLEKHVLPAVGALALERSEPLRTWRAPMVAERIRERMRSNEASVPSPAPPPPRPALPTLPGPARTVEPAPLVDRPTAPTTSKPTRPLLPPRQMTSLRYTEYGEDQCLPEQVYRIADRTITASDLRLVVNKYIEDLKWPADLGPPPHHPGCLLPPMTSAWSPPPGQKPTVQISGQMPVPEEKAWGFIHLYRQGLEWPEKWGSKPGTPGCLFPRRFQDAALLELKSEDRTDD